VTVWRPILARAAVLWVPLAAAVTGISGVVYAADLNGLRSSANDPQIQMVEEAVASLNAGASPKSVVPSTTVDMSTSLRPYLILFDGAHRPVASSVTLHGRQPDLPPSVLDGLQSGRQDRITWQPEPGVREAAVIEPWRGGAVLAGRSLRLTEERETDLELLVAAGWLGTLLLTALAAVVVGIFHPLPGPARPPGAGTMVGDRTATGPDREARSAVVRSRTGKPSTHCGMSAGDAWSGGETGNGWFRDHYGGGPVARETAIVGESQRAAIQVRQAPG
jgi:hypothetical protein